MPDKINRRSFLSHAAFGIGAVAFSTAMAPLVHTSSINPTAGGKKKLLATTDYYDNILGCKCFLDRSHFDQLHKYLSSMGVTRHQWIVDTIWDLYDDPKSDFDILAEAAESAHAHGLEFYAEIKPFEGGGFGDTLPHSLPLPKDALTLNDMRGIYPIARPFVARNKDMCLKRRPGTYEFNGPITSIRLIKRDDKATRIRPGHISLWTSSTNNRFSRYEGPLSFRESVEWRQTYPTSRQCRVLHLEGLQIPFDHKYILIRCSLSDGQGDFTNERGNIVELEGPNQKIIPNILSTGPVNFNAYRDRYLSALYKQLVRYFQLPEVQAELFNQKKAEEHYQDFYSFNERIKITDPYTLDKEGYVAIACGKPEYMLGNLHPIYPEVREHWLDMVRYCLERDVDGINIRHSNHTRSPEDWEYGFNDPVIKATGGRTDYPLIRRVNGDAYTQFLREARDLIKSRGKSITIHLYAQMLAPDDRPWRLNYIPPNFEWQWEKWVKEIADDLEFRGAWTLRPWNLRQVMDTFSSVTSAAQKPLYFQGNQKELSFGGPHNFTCREIDMINNHPGLDGFVLYETAGFTRMNEAGVIEGSTDLANLTKTKFFK